MAEKDDRATRANGVHTDDSSLADGRKGIDDDRESDEDPSTCPAILVEGFKFSEDDPSAASRVTSLVTAHFQRKRHGGGEVVGGATLLNKSTMRVAFEEERVARNVLRHPQRMKSGEHLRVAPEVFMHAQLLKLSPLVRQFFSPEELESICHSCHVKLITDEEVCGSWTAIQQLEKHLTSRLSLSNYTAGKKSSTSSLSIHHSSETDNNASAQSKENQSTARTPSAASVSSSAVAGGSVGDRKEAELCSEFEGKVQLREGVNWKSADRMSRNCQSVALSTKLSDRMDVEEPGSCCGKTQQLGQAERRQPVQKVIGKRGLYYKGTININAEKASLLRQKEMDVVTLCRKTNCHVEYVDRTIVVHGDNKDSVQDAVEAVKAVLSLSQERTGERAEASSSDVTCAVIDIEKSVALLAYRSEKEKLDTIEKEWNCYVDYVSDDKIRVYASTAAALAEGMRAVMQVYEKYARKTTHIASAEDKDLHQDSVTVIAPLMKYLLKTEQETFQSFSSLQCNYNVIDDFTKIQFSSKSKESLQACVDKFITLYQAGVSQARHTTVELAPSLSRPAIDRSLEDVQRLPQMQDCIMSLNATHTAVTIYGKGESVQAVTEYLEDEMEQRSTRFGHWHHKRPVEVDYPKTTASRGTSVNTDYCRTAIRGVKIEVLRGNLATESVDAVVNAANDCLHHSTGVALALSKAGGPDVQKECDRVMYHRQYKSLKVGEPVTTGSGRLPCKCIIHVVGPMWTATSAQSAEGQLEQACVNVLKAAHKLDVKSIAFPAISSGLVGMPKDACAKVMLGAISNYCRQGDTCIETIRIILFKPEILYTFRHRFEQMFGGQKAERTGSYGHHLLNGSNVSSLEGTGATLSASSHVTGKAQKPKNALDAASDWKASDHGRTVHANNKSMQVTVPNVSLQSTGSHTPNQGEHTMLPQKFYGKRKADNPASLARGSSPPKVSKTSAEDGSHADVDKGRSAYAEVAGKAEAASGADGGGGGGSAAAASAAADADDNSCPICLCDIDDERKLECGHRFCASCLDRANQSGFKACPTCRKPIGKPEGTQPHGCTMNVQRDKSSLPGYHCGTIVISYHIPSGVQSQEHPNPGQRYSGDSRTAYLPDNKEGKKALRLLQKAFDARLVFTIGRSVTRGVDGVVVWNDIHHKTSRSGGPACYGYPDNTYIKRLIEDLAARGIQ